MKPLRYQINLTRLMTALALFLAILAIYYPTHAFEFINFDDHEYVTQNKFVVTGLSWQNITWAFTKSHSGHYHPLSWISHMLDCELFGLNAGAHHTVNVLIHGSNVVILFLIAHCISGSLLLSFFVAAIFGIHPMRIESVAWVSERKDVLSICFGLLSILSYLHYYRDKNRWSYLLGITLFTCSLLSKPTLITLPLLLLVIDYGLLKETKSLRHTIVNKLPFIALSFCMCLIALWAQEQGGGLRDVREISVASYFSAAFQNYLIYAAKFLWPESLGIFYPFQIPAPGVGIGAVLGLAGISWLLYEKARDNRALFAGWLWFLIALVPVVGFVPIGGQAYADRWSYLPHIGLLISLCSLAPYLANNALKVYLPFFVLIGFGFHTSAQLGYWRTSETLFRHTLEVSPNNFMAHTNLGAALDQRGDLLAASHHFEEAYRLNPTYPEAINNLGSLRARFGDTGTAIDLFKKALAIRPDHIPAQRNLQIAENEYARRLGVRARYNLPNSLNRGQ